MPGEPTAEISTQGEPTKIAKPEISSTTKTGAPAESLLAKPQKTLDDFRAEMRKIVQGFEDGIAQRDVESKQMKEDLRKKIEENNKPLEKSLNEALKDPEVQSAKTELDWLNLIADIPVSGVNPELIKEIKALKQNVLTEIMKDPQGYQRKLDALKSKFYSSRGVNLQKKQEQQKPPRFQTEQELYEATIAGYDKFMNYQKDNSVITNSLSKGDRSVYIEKQSNDRCFYFVGENHFSRKPIDLIHQKLAPKIKQDPDSWLILREGGWKLTTEPSDSPSTFYVQQLSTLFNIPHEEALADLYSPDTLKYIFENEGIDEKDIDRMNASAILGGFSKEIIDNNFNIPNHVVDHIASFLRKPKEYALEIANGLFQNPPESDFEDKLDRVIRSWNNYSRTRLDEILQKYPKKTNILISAGNKHLPIIE